MILEIALGIVLGCVILANLRGVITLGVVVAAFVLLLLLLGVACWLLYTAFDATRSFLPILRLRGDIAAIVSFVGGVLVNILFAFACGQVLQERSSLSGRESTVFGALFYTLFILSVIALPVAIGAYAERQATAASLLVFVLVGIWVFVARQCRFRNQKHRRQIAA